jgi:hypothetical protein
MSANPLPVCVMAAGMAWLMLSARRTRSTPAGGPAGAREHIAGAAQNMVLAGVRLAIGRRSAPRCLRPKRKSVFFLMMTHARLRRSPGNASNSARPTVTMRPSESSTAPPAASTAATRSCSAVRYASTSDTISCMSVTNALRVSTVNETTAAQSQKPLFSRINSAHTLSVTPHFSHRSALWRRRKLATPPYR